MVTIVGKVQISKTNIELNLKREHSTAKDFAVSEFHTFLLVLVILLECVPTSLSWACTNDSGSSIKDLVKGGFGRRCSITWNFWGGRLARLQNLSPRKKGRRHKTSTYLETYSIKNDNDRPLGWLPWLAYVSQGLLVHQWMITIIYIILLMVQKSFNNTLDMYETL